MTGEEGIDDADIEEEIRRELDALNDWEVKDIEYDITHLDDEHHDHENLPLSPVNNQVADSVETYIQLLQSRNAKIQNDLSEAQDTLNLSSSSNKKELADDEKITEKLKEKVLVEIDELETKDSNSDIKHDNDETISSLEEIGLNNLKELEIKQHEKSDRLKSIFDEMKEDELSRRKKEDAMRKENRRKADEEYNMKVQENKSINIKLDEEALSKQRELKNMKKQLELDMKDLAKRQEEEQLTLQKVKQEENHKQLLQKEKACITIQKNYKRHRVMSEYGDVLEIKRKERKKRRDEELVALERREKELMEEAIRKEREEEENRLKELEERKKTEEKRRREEERMKREEEERRIKEEEEKLKREEKEKRRNEEELKRNEMKEVERRRRRDEEEKRKKEDEKKKEEEEEEMNRGKEEERQKKEDEKLKRDKEERMKVEEQVRREEAKRKCEQETKRVDEQKIRDEEKRRKVEQEKQRNEERNKSDIKRRMKQNEMEVQRRTQEDVIEKRGENNEFKTKRTEWLKRTTLWSSVSMDEIKTTKPRSRSRRPLSASQKLPSVSEEELALSLKKFTSLEKVIHVHLKDLPARNLKLLLQCPNVRSVTVQNCGLLSCESFDNCKYLKEINVSDNCIQYVSCQNIASVEQFDLSNNHLTTIHGLDGCHHLHSLKLNGNKITRIGSFPSNKVTHLSLQNNQLISTKGLSQMKYVQILDCSNNYLNQIEQIECCPLLRNLKLCGNNLQKPPVLTNHVVLREIHLSENSISSLQSLSEQWLPLLQCLYVDSNSLSNLSPLRGLPILETLDIRNNLISDEENLIPGLIGCDKLKYLSINGNPVCEDPNVRSSILKILPSLNTLDEEKVGGNVAKSEFNKGQSVFFEMCRRQINEQDEILKIHQDNTRNWQSSKEDDDQIIEQLNIQSRHFKQLLDVTIKHRIEHENFQNNVTIEDKPSSYEYPEEKNQSVKNLESTIEEPSHKCPEVTHDTSSSEKHLESTIEEPSHKCPEVTHHTSSSEKHLESTIIVQQEKDIHNKVQHHFEVKDEQTMTGPSDCGDMPKRSSNNLTSRKVEPDLMTMKRSLQHKAATVIQAHYRGFRIRRRYLEATKCAHYPGVDDDDFNFDEEVDLTMFDEDALEDGWTPTRSPQMSSVHPNEDDAFYTPSYNQKPYVPSNQNDNRPFIPRQAWRSPDSPVTQYNPRRVVPPIDATSTTTTTDEKTSPGNSTERSNRTSELSIEWGFNKNTTAELMLKRAKRMKYNALHKKKMNDPGRRYELFKKTNEANKARDVQPIKKKKEKQKIDYFTGRPINSRQSSENNTPKKDEEDKAKEEMTFSWVYDQTVLHKDNDDDIIRDTRGYLTESTPGKPERSPPVSFPRMDPAILAGRNLPLVASPVGNPRPSQVPGSGGYYNTQTNSKHFWNQEKTLSTPDLTRVGVNQVQDSREKSNSADARIMRERNNLL